jgi:hypothetical protein
MSTTDRPPPTEIAPHPPYAFADDHARPQPPDAGVAAVRDAQEAARREIEHLVAESLAQIAQRQHDAAAQIQALHEHAVHAIHAAHQQGASALEHTAHAHVDHLRALGDQLTHHLQSAGDMTHRQVQMSGEHTVDNIMHLKDQIVSQINEAAHGIAHMKDELVAQIHDAAHGAVNQIGHAAAGAAPPADPHAIAHAPIDPLGYKYK